MLLPYTLWDHVFISLVYACVYVLRLYCIANILLNALLFFFDLYALDCHSFKFVANVQIFYRQRF